MGAEVANILKSPTPSASQSCQVLRCANRCCVTFRKVNSAESKAERRRQTLDQRSFKSAESNAYIPAQAALISALILLGATKSPNAARWDRFPVQIGLSRRSAAAAAVIER